MKFGFLTYSSNINGKLVSFFVMALSIATFILEGYGSFTRESIRIVRQAPNLAMLYRESLEIKTDFVFYVGAQGPVAITVLPGDGYDITAANTIVPTIEYNSNWPSAGVVIQVNVQLTDSVSESEVYPVNITVIPPILPVAYFERSCEGTITFTASAYKPTQTSVISFPFVFQLFDSEGNLFDERTIVQNNPFSQNATAVFGLEDNEIDRDEEYRLVVTDNLGRVYERNSGPLGQAYQLDIAINFAGLVCADDNSGVAEFVITNAAMPLVDFSIFDNAGHLYTSDYTVQIDEDGLVVLQTADLVPGEYTVEIVDQFSCNGTRTFDLKIPNPITFRSQISPISCPENYDGGIELEITGGWSQPFPENPRDTWAMYGIVWYDQNGRPLIGSTSTFFENELGEIVGVRNQITGLTSGTYYAEIIDQGRLFEFPDTDPIACIIRTETFTIEGPPPLQLQSVKTDIGCNGEQNGHISIDPIGGIPDYQIIWYKGNFSDLSDPNLSEVTILPGTSGQTLLENLVAGEYAVLLRDQNGCFTAENFTIIEPEELIISEVPDSRIDIRCFGETTGAFSISIDQESVGPYTVQVHAAGEDPGSTQTFLQTNSGAFDIVGLGAGEYVVSIADANGCQKEITGIVLTQPADGLSVEVMSVTNYNGFGVSCTGNADGAISVNVSGGSGNLDFIWSGPNNFTSTNLELENLEAGLYEFVVTDENNCSATTGTIELLAPDPLEVSVNISEFNGFQISCHGASDASISVGITGGTGNYSISWSGPDRYTSTAPDIDNLPPGLYTLEVIDLNECQFSQEIEIREPSPLEIAEDESLRQNILCFGQSTGVIHIDILSQSVGPFLLELGMASSTDALFSDPRFIDGHYTFTDLAAGEYWVQVKDANGCVERLENIVLTEPDQGLVLTDIQISDYNGFQISCFGAEDGIIQFGLSGSHGVVTYLWSGPNGFTSDNSSLSGLGPGEYTVRIEDETSCFLTETFFLEEPAPLSAQLAYSDYLGFGVSCYGAEDGFIDLNLRGGTSEYTISWSGPDGFNADTERIEGLSKGTYSYRVVDSNDCVIDGSYEILEPEILTASVVEIIDVLCYGEGTGGITLNVSGGSSANYRFIWTRNGLITDIYEQSPNNLLAGNYSIQIIDDSGCAILLENIRIEEPDTPISVALTATEVSCYNSNDGSITSEISGGVGPYEIRWNFGSIQPNLTGLAPGYYELTVTDANGCVHIAGVEIPDVPFFAANPEVGHVTCFGENDGFIRLNIGGGVLPIRALWDHGPESAALYNLGPGEYGVTIMGADGCSFRNEFIITEPDLLIVTGIVEDAVLCDDGQSGSINLIISGGRPPFQYTWSNGAETQNIHNLSSGDYSVEVIDSAGCFAMQRFRVRRPLPIQVTAAQYTEAQCDPRSIKEVFELNIDGGVAPYTIEWSSGSVFEKGYRMETEEPGLYTLTVTDAEGCQYVESFEVDNFRVVLSASYSSQSYATYAAHLVNMDVQFTNNSSGPLVEYYWDFGDGNASNDENPTHRFQSEGTYEVTLHGVDLAGCEHLFLMEITIFDHFLETPNVFTPNQDGLNDYFFPKFLQVSSIDFRIMNKWGEIIFHTEELQSVGWDGMVNGEEALPGNYVYQVRYSTIDGRSFTRTGVFLLMK